MNKLTPDQKKRLSDPLPPEAIKPHPTKAYLSSIKAIYVIERFNEVFGIGGWEITNQFVERDGKWIVVKSCFEAQEWGIRIPDIFGGNDNPDLGDAYKGACTDALTKIGSYLGVGMDVFKGLSEPKAAKQKPAPDPKAGDGDKPDKRTPANQGLKPWLNPGTKEWDNAFTKIHTGEITVDDVLKHYRISKPNHENLLNPKFKKP